MRAYLHSGCPLVPRAMGNRRLSLAGFLLVPVPCKVGSRAWAGQRQVGAIVLPEESCAAPQVDSDTTNFQVFKTG